jgi:hypothetical protein
MVGFGLRVSDLPILKIEYFGGAGGDMLYEWQRW